MADTVFILGAGASKLAGAPLMGDFLDTAHDLWKLGKTSDSQEDFNSVFEAISLLQRVHSKSQLNIDNIESVFAAFEMAKTLGTFPGKDVNQISDLIKSLKRLIVKTLELSVKFPIKEQHIDVPPPPYHEFIKMVSFLRGEAKPNHSVAILTFNYDIALDYAVNYSCVNIDYGIGNEAVDKIDSLPVIKLHGSLNWTTSVNNGDIVPWSLKNYFKTHERAFNPNRQKCMIPIGSQLKEMNNKKQIVNGEPVIVPPSWNKEDSHRALTKVWTRAAKELKNAENIFIIGYSMPLSDAFFQYLYALGTVGKTVLKKIWVYNIDPPKGEVEDRFRKILGPAAEARFKYFPYTFKKAIREIKDEFSK